MSGKAVILHDNLEREARKDEEDVLLQIQVVLEQLTFLGYGTTVIPFSLNLKEMSLRLRKLCPELVFNLVEAVGGSGRLIHLAPALLDTLNIPYTGAPTEAMFLSTNKLLAKSLVVSQGISTPAWAGFRQGGPFRPGRYIIKSIWEHASLGLDQGSIIEAADWPDLEQALARRRRFTGDPCFAETFIDGREFNISLLASEEGPEALPPAEMQFHDYPADRERIVDYRAKWEPGSREYNATRRTFVFPPGDDLLLDELKTISLKCWEVFGMRGFARVDYRVDKRGKPWFLEINANPCLSPDGGFLAALHKAGISLSSAIERIIDDTQT